MQWKRGLSDIVSKIPSLGRLHHGMFYALPIIPTTEVHWGKLSHPINDGDRDLCFRSKVKKNRISKYGNRLTK